MTSVVWGGRLREFWAEVIDVWQNGVYGIDIGHMLAALAVFLLFMLIRNLFSRFILNRITALAARTTTDLDDAVIEAIEPPVRFIPVVLGFFLGTSVLELDAAGDSFVANINRSLIAFTIFWALYRAAKPVGVVLNQAQGVLTEPMIEWLAKAIRGAFIVIGAATILELWGIQVGPLIAGLGLFGVAVALGAQDLFKNLISGLFLIGEKRFNPGDWILVDGVVEGTVEQIGFRTTIVRRFDKAPVYVPNSMLSDESVTNFTRMTFRRIKWVIGVRYDTSADQLTQIRDEITQYIQETPDFAKPEDATTFVRIDKFGSSSIDLMLYCFTHTTQWLEWLEVKEGLLLAIKRIVTDAGSDFAYPSQSLYIESLPEKPDAPAPQPIRDVP